MTSRRSTSAWQALPPWQSQHPAHAETISPRKPLSHCRGPDSDEIHFPKYGDDFAEENPCHVADGGVDVTVGTSSHGQGHRTAFAMIVQDLLGIPMEKVVEVMAKQRPCVMTNPSFVEQLEEFGSAVFLLLRSR